ncbi:YbaY family lipoprotein [Croceibacterium sp. LX-88]|jgi:putative lipoprotein|uniref:YbaY family lipoprotein n=1 Tax=Croceibacterium selenioxidans TaxID=2838833 RepID=A0ABS5W866_9SPHN|nr:YbaY family lipoprotein [Croceibacterium selenioxidans]MBT2134574.1 YbaY family lipoprotein [Croceibacterium selenioxidans]
MRRSYSAMLLALGLAACSTPSDGGGGSAANHVTLQGTVAYRERIALIPDAVVTVQIRDVSLQDAPSVTIASTEFKSEGRQVPIPFSLKYDPAKIEPRRTYSVFARIDDAAGRMLWITDTHNPLPPPGQSIALNLVSANR